eukprot:1686888-Pyramimonas_sp.AAC.1
MPWNTRGFIGPGVPGMSWAAPLEKFVALLATSSTLAWICHRCCHSQDHAPQRAAICNAG